MSSHSITAAPHSALHLRFGRTPPEPELLARRVYIPAGDFSLGSVEHEYEKPIRRPVRVKAFLIDAYPFTNRRYRALFGQGRELPIERLARERNWDENARRQLPAFTGRDGPVVAVEWAEALEICEQVGGTLPSEIQWEYAASGAWRDGRKREHPWESPLDGETRCEKKDPSWSESPRPNLWGIGSNSPAPVLHGLCCHGLRDMIGNVWEWCREPWDARRYHAIAEGSWEHELSPEIRYQDIENDDEARNAAHVIRGASYQTQESRGRCSARDAGPPESSIPIHTIGFRVAYPLDEKYRCP